MKRLPSLRTRNQGRTGRGPNELIQRARRTGRTLLTEPESKQLLARCMEFQRCAR